MKVMLSLAGWIAGRAASSVPSQSEQSAHFDSSGVSDHFAIIPTGIGPARMRGDALRLWETVAAFRYRFFANGRCGQSHPAADRPVNYKVKGFCERINSSPH